VFAAGCSNTGAIIVVVTSEIRTRSAMAELTRGQMLTRVTTPVARDTGRGIVSATTTTRGQDKMAGQPTEAATTGTATTEYKYKFVGATPAEGELTLSPQKKERVLRDSAGDYWIRFSKDVDGNYQYAKLNSPEYKRLRLAQELSVGAPVNTLEDAIKANEAQNKMIGVGDNPYARITPLPNEVIKQQWENPESIPDTVVDRSWRRNNWSRPHYAKDAPEPSAAYKDAYAQAVKESGWTDPTDSEGYQRAMSAVEKSVGYDKARQAIASIQSSTLPNKDKAALIQPLSDLISSGGVTYDEATISVRQDGKDRVIPIKDWVGLAEQAVSEIGEVAGYRKNAQEWIEGQVASGQARNLTEAEAQLAEVRSGKYQVYDYDTERFVAVTRKAYDEREALYQQYPEAGAAPGMVSLPEAIKSKQQRYKTLVMALGRLKSAGFVDKLEGTYMTSADAPSLREFTISTMAEFARNNPDGMQVLRDAGFDEDVLSNVAQWNKVTGDVVAYLDNGVGTIGTGLSAKLNLPAGEINALGRAMDSLGIKPVSGSYVEAYRHLVDDQKRMVAALFEEDYSKGSAFASFAKDIENLSSKGLAFQLLTAPIQPITTPIGKQLTLDEAKAQLSQEYAPVLSALMDYVKPDGTFDINKYEQAVKSDPEVATKARIATGYDDADAVKNSMEYYNYATQVTPKEWATAGLVAVLDVAMMGGAGALAGLGVGGRIAGQALSFGTPIALGVLQAPDVAKMIASPDYSTGEKVVAGLGEAAMFSPLAGLSIRGAQWLRTVSRPDYVPARSLIIEASTPRAVFSPYQVAKLMKAGATKADFIRLSNEVETAMTSGKKSVTVNFKGVPVRVRNVTYQVATGGGARFTGVPDITLFTRGEGTPVPLIKKFYNSYKTALEPIRRSYNEGQPATRPGIVEVRISDPALAETLMAQQRGGWKTAKGGYELELEGVMPSLNELRGRGYDLVPIPGKSGRGVTFDAELGPIEIRRFTLAKVVDNPTGLIRVKTGGRGDGGVVGVGDLHATTKFQSVFNDINSSFADPVIRGNPSKPSTWSWNPSTSKGRTVVVLGDSIDRGTAYNTWRTTLNRLSEEATRVGDKVERVLGNHELAYLSRDNIKGTPITPDNVRASIRNGIIEDIQAGRVKAAVGADGKLFTHAGVSKGVFPELSMSKLEAVNKYLKSAGDLMRKACNI